MEKKVLGIVLNALPVILMVALIPFVGEDYTLAVIYILIIIASLSIKREPKDFLFLIFGFLIMTLCEYIFTSTGVESFNRDSLFGLMPVWLPFLWSYAFVTMKRVIVILEN